MESVNKLREWSKRYNTHWTDPKTGEMTVFFGEWRPSGEYERFSVNEGEKLCELLDEIEQEHEREMTEQLYSLTVDMEPMTDENMAKDGWMKLPVDADGKVIRIGDKVTYDFGYGETLTVQGLGVPNGRIVDADRGVFAFKDGEYHWFSASSLRHVELPTVEDMLREFAHNWCSSATGTGNMTKAELDVAQANVIIEYGEKLREMLNNE